MLSRHGSESTSPCSCLCSECCWVARTSAKSRSSSKDLHVQTLAAVQTRVLSTVSTTLSLELTTLLDHLQQWWVFSYLWCRPRRLWPVTALHTILSAELPIRLTRLSLTASTVQEVQICGQPMPLNICYEPKAQSLSGIKQVNAQVIHDFVHSMLVICSLLTVLIFWSIEGDGEITSCSVGWG